MSYGRITPEMLRHMARLVEMGLADGEYSVEDVSYVRYTGDDDYRQRYRPDLDRYVLELNVSPSAPSQRSLRAETAWTAYQEFAAPKPKPDGGPAVDLLIAIMKVIVKAWTMDDTSKRFRMLELD